MFILSLLQWQVQHISKNNGRSYQGSPLNALCEPFFKEYHFIDLDKERVNILRKLQKENPQLHVYQGDCNEILINKISNTYL